MKHQTQRRLRAQSLIRIGLLTLLGAALSGCGGGSGGTGPSNPAPGGASGGGTGPVNAGQIVYVQQDEKARALLAQMTLQEKVGQMIMAEQGFLRDPNDIERYHLGALLSGAGSGPKSGPNTLGGWTAMIAAYQNRARQTRLKIPLLYGIDAVHGNNNVPGATIFPHNIGLGATNDADLVRRIAGATAQETRAIGANWDFSPCIAVPQDVRWGRTYEGFGQDPNLVRNLGAATVKGLQTQNLSAPDSILACAKHFVGDGGTLYGTSPRNGFGLDQGDTRVSQDTLRNVHLPGYRDAVAAGAGSVMVSYNSWNGVKCSASKFLLTDLLKGELGFAGIVLSDYDALDQLGPNYKENIATSVNAGMDMIMVTDKYAIVFDNLVELVNEGRVPLARVDDAVTRILRVKAAMGLLEPNPNSAATSPGSFGSAAHRELARQAVRESLVLLKNNAQTLPLSKTARLAVSGSGADNTGAQCGGWTINWQGQSGNVVPGATSILAAMRDASREPIDFAPGGVTATEADVNVVIISETPYAEWLGDAQDLAISPADNATIERARATGKPVVLVILSGRPLILGDALDKTDALVAAWLPGSQGQGVADVLFGDYSPTGKLPVVWPRTMEQLPINLTTNAKAGAQFEAGYGLSYN